MSELFGKTANWQQIYRQTNPTYYTSNGLCLQNIMLKKNYWGVITRAFLYKSDDVHTSAGAYISFISLFGICIYNISLMEHEMKCQTKNNY